MVTISMLLAQLSGMPSVWGTSRLWPLIAALPVASAILQLLLLPLILESPNWLEHVGRADEALHLRLALEGSSSKGPLAYTGILEESEYVIDLVDAAASLSEYVAEVVEDSDPYSTVEVAQAHILTETQSGQGGSGGNGGTAQSSVFILLADPQLRSKLAVAVATLVTQQLSGINVAFNYSTVYLQENGVSSKWIDSTTVWMNIANVGSTLVAAWLIGRFGRRTLLLNSTLCMTGFIGLITYGMLNISTPVGVRAATGGIVCFVTAFGLGLGPIPWIVPAELFSQTHRATAMGVAALCNW